MKQCFIKKYIKRITHHILKYDIVNQCPKKLN